MWFSRAITFVNAHVVQAEGRLGRTLRIRRGRVDGIDVAPDKRDAVIDLEGAFIFPGLINAHDHLELNSQPRLKWRDRYANATEWIADFQPRFESDPDLAVARPDTLDDRVWIGGLKNLLCGVTTVGHHNPMHRALGRRFPIKVLNRFGYSHSLHIDGQRVAESHHGTPADWPWMIHAAEGTDEAAHSEIAALDRLGCLTGNTVLIHGVALCPNGRQRVIEAGAGLVWCPSSNRFLFNTTADVRSFGRLCELESTAQLASSEKSREGFSLFLYTSMVDSAGNEHQKVEIHPAIKLEGDTAVKLRPYYEKFGLEPVGRSRISVPKPADEPQSKWAGVLK